MILKSLVSISFILLFCQIGISQKIIGSISFGDPNKFRVHDVSKSADSTEFALGINYNYNESKVQIYKNNNNNYELIGQELPGRMYDEWYGYDLDLTEDGKRIIIGTYQFQGYVEVFEIIDGIWAKIGNTLNNGIADYNFGQTVSISSNGRVIAVGAPGGAVGINSEKITSKAYLYEEISGQWVKMGQPISEIGSVSMSLDGKTVAGISYQDKNPGKIKVFRYINNEWKQIGEDINENIINSQVLNSVSISADGNTIAIGAFGWPYDNAPCYVKVLNFDGNNWKNLGQVIEGELGEYLGHRISLSGDGKRIAISAHNKKCPIRIFDFIGNKWFQVGNPISDNEHYLGEELDLSKNGKTLVFYSSSPNTVQLVDLSNLTINNYDCKIPIDSSNTEVLVFPNPTTGLLYINDNLYIDSLILESTIHDVLGRKFEGYNSTYNSVDISSFPAGIYFLEYKKKIYKIIKVDN